MHKRTIMSRLLPFLMTVLFISSVIMPYDAIYGLSDKNQEPLEIVLTQGKAAITANGANIPCQKPFKSANCFYIPMQTVLETIGADIETAADKTIKITYRDITVEIKAGAWDFTLNSEKKLLPAPPVLSGTVVMIPLEFLKLGFGINTTYDDKTGKATILLKEDGSLSDLSFLTGSITTSKAGNSYFGWNISLPKGTRVSSQSFNSKYILFENEHFGFDLEITVGFNEGKTLKQFYDQIREDPYSLLDAEPMDSTLVLDANPQYVELLYNDEYDEAVYERIYVKGSNCIDVIVTSYSEVDPAKLKADKTVKRMFDSFNPGYKGNTADTADLSSVNNGLAKYNSYITSETTGKKYLSWEMNILPEWDLAETASSNPFNTRFDGKPGEYVKVELSTADAKADIETAGKKMSDSYAKNFNPAIFSLKSGRVKQEAGYKCYEMVFEAKYGSVVYDFNERLILENGILYDITYKAPVAAFAKGLESFGKMFGSFKTSVKDNDSILVELQKNAFNQTKNNIGKEDALTVYENKTFKWKLTLPGYFQKNSTSGQSLENFYDNTSGAVVIVEASAIKGGETAKADSERFMSMKLSDKMSEKPVKTAVEQIKGRNVTIVQYRIDDKESESFADVNYYLFDEGGFRYCFMTTIPDITSSEFNLNMIKNIWESLEIMK
jgi:hypothetical protein